MTELEAILAAIEAILRREGRWSETPPPPEALASEMPFCHDTLPFEHWLQWVLIPRLRQLESTGQPLPRGSAIAPYAEVMLERSGWGSAALVARLRELDALLNR